MSEHCIMLTLADDLVIIATWQPRVNQWYNWGSVHIDAFYPEYVGTAWQQELRENGRVILNAKLTLDQSMQLPPDNLT